MYETDLFEGTASALAFLRTTASSTLVSIRHSDRAFEVQRWI